MSKQTETAGALPQAAIPPASSAPAAPAPALRFAAWLVTYWTVVALALVLLVFALASPNFYSRANWLATSLYMTGILTLAVGQTFAIISGGIDLSIGGIMAVSAMAGALGLVTLVELGFPDFWSILAGIGIALLAGAAVGLINGVLITKLKLVPFIVTLGMLGVARGATNLLNNGQEVSSIPLSLTLAGSKIFGGWIPALVLVCAIVTVIAGVVLAKTRFGLRTYYIGSNREGARRAGVNVDAHLIAIYVISGVIAAIAGVMMTARFGVAQTNAGEGSELASIAAVVIGGASLFGGSGSIFGTVVGAALMSVMVTGLILAGVQPFWQMVFTGLIIIGAVYIDQLREKVRLSVR